MPEGFATSVNQAMMLFLDQLTCEDGDRHDIGAQASCPSPLCHFGCW